jgi:hypothetical protein
MNQTATTAQDGADLNQILQRVQTREDFSQFVRLLLAHLRQKPEEWENRDLASYLEALSAWVEDMEGYYQNAGQVVPEHPTWKTLGQILLAAKVYE